MISGQVRIHAFEARHSAGFFFSMDDILSLHADRMLLDRQ